MINFFEYEEDSNYNKDLDTNYILKISRKESIEGTEKKIKVKKERLLCSKDCKECKRATEKVFNLLENNCGELQMQNQLITVKIPKGIKNNQSVLFIGEGERKGNKYGNLKVTVKVSKI